MILGKVSKGAGRLPVGGAIVFFKSVAAVDYVSALFTLSVAARCQHPPKIRLFVRISKCKFFFNPDPSIHLPVLFTWASIQNIP